MSVTDEILVSPEVLECPYDFYRRVREEAPVHRTPMGFYVVSRYEDVLSVVRQPAVREQMLVHGAEPAAPASPEEFAAFIRAESARWGKVVRAAGLQPE